MFRPDAATHFALLAAVCERFGLQALAPFDASATAQSSPQAIYTKNMTMLRTAQGVAANLSPFRGPEPDSGTAFEIGAAVALGLPVVGYGLPPGDYASRIPNAQRDSIGALRDPSGMSIEDFGLPANLMLACSIRIEDTAEDALAALAGILAATA